MQPRPFRNNIYKILNDYNLINKTKNAEERKTEVFITCLALIEQLKKDDTDLHKFYNSLFQYLKLIMIQNKILIIFSQE